MSVYLPLLAVGLVLFLLLCAHEFRLYARTKAASARLEHGKTRGGFITTPKGHRRLP